MTHRPFSAGLPLPSLLPYFLRAVPFIIGTPVS